ncbi:type I CRISPR-associated protein Cas8a1/Csx8 [Ruminococcus sp. FMB-CY1]|uniref:type I CRISPR-associated protein Cas8a1/Csx8 n=1 Tax=unclassified Ruminococcus TaxID=2608920 RepID=UPI00208ECAD8|nr:MULTISPECIES: type I CRISPR-associated protein Cas8a1/Csx8 [unclassified Ruminococcus]USP70077.1 type I CRISPR-associated protein Cas8a1/Csx8 [Ruminococcus sp. FMBCY1]WBX56609.1 type I CRISPR-associated protein Cas8a1/Csx8 [Ruminococcus sp. FMB-CY1]
MKTKIDYFDYDTLLQPTDWRFAAAVVGLCKYFDYFGIDYKVLCDVEEKPDNYLHGFDGIIYKSEDITEEKYLEFAENYFEKYMTHKNILNILESQEFSEEQIKLVNDLVKSKTVLKGLFDKIKFNGTNKDIFISTIEENRAEIIKNIFKNGNNLYKNYCNERLIFTEDNSTCRLRGYNVDKDRKTSNLGFCFSKESFESNDILEFDFIPFAFSNSDMRETYFVNNNFSVKSLTQTNYAFSNQLSSTENKDDKNKLMLVLQNSKDYISYDVEIISKSQDKAYYETFFVRLERLKKLRELSGKSLNFVKKINDDYWFNLEKEVYMRCLNNVLLDDVILMMLKFYFDDNAVKGYIKSRTDMLIDINVSWKGNEIMDEIKSAKSCGFLTSQKLIEMKSSNKINSYKQKIISALCAHDYDRAKEIILSLSAYVGMEFSFFYTFLENAEENKDLAFAFASALIEVSPKNN